MLIEPMIQQLQQLRLRGMATALQQLHDTPHQQALTFEEQLSLLIQHELTDRHSQRLAQRLRWAKLPQSAALEDIDMRAARGIDPKLIALLTALGWIKDKLNALITGPCGVGKSFIASALAHAACRADYSVRAFRLPRLVEELTKHHAQANRSAFLKQLAKVDLLYIDDFGLAPLADQTKRDCWKSLKTATTRNPRSSPASFPLSNGTPISMNPRSPMPSSTDWCITAIDLISTVVPCVSKNALLPSRQLTATKHFHHSHTTLTSPGRLAPELLAAITRNQWPPSAEYAI